MRRRPAVVLAALAVFVFSSVGAGTAAADEDYDINITYQEPSTGAIQYGEYWSFYAMSDEGLGFLNSANVTMTGATGYAPELYYNVGSLDFAHQQPFSISPSTTQPALAPGSYTFTITAEGGFSDTHYHGRTNTPATLTVSAAPLGIDLRVIADPNNPDDAIVSVGFTGQFAEEYIPSAYPGAAQSPGGTWRVTIKDADGEVVTERNFERAAGSDVLASSFYWFDSEPGEQYTATAEFSTTGASETNFDIADAQVFTYTAPDEQRETPVSATEAGETPPLPDPGFGLPLWSVILAGIVAAGLIALTVVFSVRLSHTRRPMSAEGVGNATAA
jgi:hypothetical protein